MPTLFADVVGPSWDLVADVQLLLQYPFMRNAYIAGTLVALVAGVIGYFMVLRSQSFAGHSLANVGFAGATGAALVGIAPSAGLMIATLLAALGIHVVGVSARQARRDDIAVGAVFTAALALGYLFVALSSSPATATIYNVLFGNVVGIGDADVRASAIGVAVLLFILAVVGRPLLFASLDPDVAAARGVPMRALGLIFLLLLAVTTAIAVQIVGVLLIFSLLVTPAAIARRLSTRPALAIALSAILALAFTWLGLAAGYFTLYPTGFFITTFAFAAYLLVRGAEWLAAVRASAVPPAATTPTTPITGARR